MPPSADVEWAAESLMSRSYLWHGTTGHVQPRHSQEVQVEFSTEAMRTSLWGQPSPPSHNQVRTSLWGQPSPPASSNGLGASTCDIPQHNRGKIQATTTSQTPTCLLNSLIRRVPLDVPPHFPPQSSITCCLDPMGYPWGGTGTPLLAYHKRSPLL
ncbi:hypothetical protein E2320_006501 [Naja naja]|nr:hypothetical protein E2320_006501 [Naja naja]